MVNKVIDPAPIIKHLAARCLESKGLECSVLGSVIDMLKAAPAVDAVEVVHGRWEFEKNPYMRDAWTYRCTACDGRYSDNPRYCPNCGAKMDGDGNV